MKTLNLNNNFQAYKGFEDFLSVLKARAPWEELSTYSSREVRTALNKRFIGPDELLALLSPAAETDLEDIAERSRDTTLRNFGRAVEIFTPLYLANICTNRCVYCGYNSKKDIPRIKLSLEEVEKEAQAIRATGLRNLLILTGDAPKLTGVDYLEECTKVLVKYFPSLGIEVPSMKIDEYARLSKAGVYSLTMFQETYNEELYKELHPAGPKRDFAFRLNAPERAIKGGIRAINLGALLGLDEWRRDIFITGMHARFLQTLYPEISMSISLPRIRPCGEKPDSEEEQAFEPKLVSDKNIVQALLALRLFLPQAGITLSTRESATFRENMIPLGVTRISAGVSTGVGGHSLNVDHAESGAQFDIADDRSVDEIALALEKLGYQPVFTDWLLADQGRNPLTKSISKTLGTGLSY